MQPLRSLTLTHLLLPVASVACVDVGDGGYEIGDTSSALTETQAIVDFDFDNGNIASEYIIPNIIPSIVKNFNPSDASLVLYTTSTVVSGQFDAIAPYSDTMVGYFSRLPRRPASEGVTNRNRNIAILYASLHTLSAVLPNSRDDVRALVANVGLDPDDDSTDLSTPVGIGNVAGRAVVEARARDGFNRDGDEGGRKYNLKPYADYTGYQPVNTPYELRDPSRWQPRVIAQPGGLFRVQQYVTPQWALTQPFSFDDPNEFRSPAPFRSDWQRHPREYKRQTDEVLRESARLNDYRKMAAELFDHKFASLGRAGNHVRLQHELTLEEFIQYDWMVQVAAFDAGIVTFKDKTDYDAVRPFSSIRFLYGDKRIRAWGGPGQGTVNDMLGSEWESYLPTADHPEYPSASSCFCAAHAQANRRFLGTDEFGWEVERPAGSSVIEPGITPAKDVTLSFATFTEFEQVCGKSRVWGGTHYWAAVDEARELCRPVGDRAYELMRRHVRGDVDGGNDLVDEDSGAQLR